MAFVNKLPSFLNFNGAVSHKMKVCRDELLILEDELCLQLTKNLISCSDNCLTNNQVRWHTTILADGIGLKHQFWYKIGLAQNLL